MKEYQKAFSIYESIVNDPAVKSPLLYSDLASANYLLNNKDKFVEYMELSIKTFPEDLAQYIGLSYYYNQEKQLDKAIAVLEMGLKIEPRYAKFYNDLGVLYESKGNNEKSLEYQTKGVFYDFRYAKGHFNLSILAENYKNDLKTALFEARIALNLDPSYPRHIVRVATLYEKLNMKKEADDAIKSFLFRDSDLDITTLVSLGRLYVMRGDYIKAEKYYNEALIIDPQSEYAKSNMEALQSYQKTANSMINAALQAIKINPYDDQAYKTLISWHINNKKYDEARKVLDKVYSLGLKDLGFDLMLERLNGLIGN
jgi:pentatricopeptide repeat protein